MKLCAACNELKEYAAFAKARKAKDGLQSYCKDCLKAYKERWYEENKDRANKRAREWQNNNPKKFKEIRRTYATRHREEILQRSRAYEMEHKEERKIKDARYAQENPEKIREKTARRRALKRGSQIEPVDYARILQTYGEICDICGQEINIDLKWPDPNSLSYDHVIPLSKRGPHIPENIRPTHLDCNIRKTNK